MLHEEVDAEIMKKIINLSEELCKLFNLSLLLQQSLAMRGTEL